MENNKGRPLEGIRVIELATAWAGPLCASLLADMGAEVVKIENPEFPDLTRRFPPFTEGKPGVDQSGYFAVFNRGKKNWALDLKIPENQEMVKKLVKVSDVVVQNFAPGVLDKLGLGYDILKEIKPDIIMVSLSGYGVSGPNKNGVAFGQVLETFVGLSPLIGKPDGTPFGCGFPVPDHTSGVDATFAVLAALRHRDRTGEGQQIDVSEIETLLCCMPEALMEFAMNGREPKPMGNKDSLMAPHGCFRCKGQDKWVAIAIKGENEWWEFCKTIGSPDMAHDERFHDLSSRLKHQDELNVIITDWTRGYAPLEVMKMLQRIGICCGPVYNAEEMYQDRQLIDRNFFVKTTHPLSGERYVPGIFARLTETPGKVSDRDHLLGEDNDWIVNHLLGTKRE